MRFLAADHHLGEDRFQIMQRPFSTPEEHVEHIIKRHNAKVGKDDEVWFVGDVLYKGADPEIYLPMIQRMNGVKTLFRGNHDAHLSDADFAPYFREVIPEGEGRYVDIDGLRCYVVHYPTLSVTDAFNLMGHIHGAYKFQLNALNVGVDVHHFDPVSETEVGFFYKAICEFYDDDVWAAYQESNSQFVGKRGKQGSYFKR